MLQHNPHCLFNDAPFLCVKRLIAEVIGHPSSGEKVFGESRHAGSENWRPQMALVRKDVTLPEYLSVWWNEIMLANHIRAGPALCCVPSYENNYCNNLNVCLKDREQDYVSLQPVSWWRLDKISYDGVFLLCFQTARPLQTPPGCITSIPSHTQLPLPLVRWVMLIVLNRNFGLSCLFKVLILSLPRWSAFHLWVLAVCQQRSPASSEQLTCEGTG